LRLVRAANIQPRLTRWSSCFEHPLDSATACDRSYFMLREPCRSLRRPLPESRADSAAWPKSAFFC
jgi:hypothetical protein